MTNHAPTISLPASGTSSRAVQLAFAGLLGLFVVSVVGFTHIPAVHNATHDVRHAMGFPCH